jgi:hypothetical protein
LKNLLLLLILVISCLALPVAAKNEIGRFQISAVDVDTYFILDTKTGVVFRCMKKKCERVKAPQHK